MLTVATPKRRLLDLSVILALVVGAVLLSSVTADLYFENYDHSVLWLRLVSRCISCATALALVFYALSSQGRRLRDIGLRPCWSDIPLAILLALVSWYAGRGYDFLRLYFWRGGVMPMFSGHVGEMAAHISVLLVVMLLLGAAFEEVIVRAYLMTEVMDLTTSRVLAIVLSVALQSSYHSYQGVYQIGAKAAGFLPYALFFAYTRRSTPTILAHLLTNLYIVWQFGRL